MEKSLNKFNIPAIMRAKFTYLLLTDEKILKLVFDRFCKTVVSKNTSKYVFPAFLQL